MVDNAWRLLWQQAESETNLGWFRRAVERAGYTLLPGSTTDLDGLVAAAVGEYGREETSARVRAIVLLAQRQGMGFQKATGGVLLWTPVLRGSAAAVGPAKAYPGDAGYDLVCQVGAVCLPGEVTYIPQGVRVAFPPGVWGMICGRSSALRRRGLKIHEGVIDNGYTGELEAAATPVGSTAIAVQAGDRICQLVLHSLPPEVTVEQTGDLPPTARGDNGYGSSG